MLRVECGEWFLFRGNILRIDIRREERVRELYSGRGSVVFVDFEDHGGYVVYVNCNRVLEAQWRTQPYDFRTSRVVM